MGVKVMEFRENENGVGEDLPGHIACSFPVCQWMSFNSDALVERSPS
jgi:hypothetical protein